MTALILFWISILALLHTYILYPAILKLIGSGKLINNNTYSSARELPGVSVIMAVHNEQNVLEEKISSIVSNNIPEGKIEILVGSDASTDNTNEILEKLTASLACLRFVTFLARRGKSAIINDLVRMSDKEILIITDANVLFGRETIYQLLKHFRNNDIGLVDSNMKHKGLKRSGISVQENSYVTREVETKFLEGIIWGTMMGPFGGCYAIKRKLYRDVPVTYLVDDFYINMNVILSGHKAILEPDAHVYEDVSNSLGEEFRRKIRIATGNFQNLMHFRNCICSSVPGLSLSFFSHKVLRWIGPLFMALVFITSILLSRENILFRYILGIELIILVLPIIDYLLGKIKIHIIILRFVTHFLSMNLALVVGFIKFLKGVKSNVWQPTRRNQ